MNSEQSQRVQLPTWSQIFLVLSKTNPSRLNNYEVLTSNRKRWNLQTANDSQEKFLQFTIKFFLSILLFLVEYSVIKIFCNQNKYYKVLFITQLYSNETL